MEILTILIGWGWLWTLLLWRSIASYSIYKEVVEQKTTRDAILFVVFQGAIYLFVAYIYGKSIQFSVPEIVTEIMFISSGVANLIFGFKSLVVFKKNGKSNQSSEPTLKTPGDSVDG